MFPAAREPSDTVGTPAYDYDYDYVVVGAGTAGCVIAARLSEDPGVRVLLLEAGSGSPLPEMAIPGAWTELLDSSASWRDSTVEQAFSGTTVPVPRGRCLGGSSSINGLNFVRGHRSSYDAWVDQGATGWGWDDLLPWFQRSESAVGGDPTLRGVDGPLVVGPPPEPSPAVLAVLAGAQEVGHPVAHDISGGLETGFGLSGANVVDGVRQSAADAYLTPALARPNLDVVVGATVTRVRVVDGACTGVEHTGEHGSAVVEPRAEVILAAGAIGTAHLLLVSGIGPADHLRERGVEVVLDLPGVGANLHDHPMSTVVYAGSRELPEDLGNLTAQGIGLVRTDPDLAGPDLQILVESQPYRAEGLDGPDNGFAICFSAVTPHSRGSVRLSSADPAEPPLIDPDYLGDERDVEVMRAGLATSLAIGRARALDGWRGEQAQPAGELSSPEDVREYLRRSLVVYFHYAGTCRVGTDDLAVVDPRLRLRGVSGLRVADASIMPSPVSANTNATVYAIAERAAALISGSA